MCVRLNTELVQERQQEFRAERSSAIQAISSVSIILACGLVCGPVHYLVVLLALTFPYFKVLLID